MEKAAGYEDLSNNVSLASAMFLENMLIKPLFTPRINKAVPGVFRMTYIERVGTTVMTFVSYYLTPPKWNWWPRYSSLTMFSPENG